MSIYGELDPMVEHRISRAFDSKREHKAKVNIPNMAYPGQHIDIEILHGSRDHIIVPDTVKITFSLDIASTDKARSVVNNGGRALVEKKLILGSKSIDTINNSDIYDMYKELFLSEKEREERLLQGIQLANGLKARVCAKKADDTALTATTQENAIKKTLDNRFAIPLDFGFLKNPVCLYGLREYIIVRLELYSSQKVILCTGDTSATCKLSDILLEYDAIFDEPYGMATGEMYVESLIPYTRVESIHYQPPPKKDTLWKIDVNDLSVCLLQGLLLLFLEKRDDFANKNDEFYNPSIKNILVTINRMPHQLLLLDDRPRTFIRS